MKTSPSVLVAVVLAGSMGCAAGGEAGSPGIGGAGSGAAGAPASPPVTECAPPAGSTGFGFTTGIECPGSARTCAPSPSDPTVMVCTEIDYGCDFGKNLMAGAGPSQFAPANNCVGTIASVNETYLCYGETIDSCPPPAAANASADAGTYYPSRANQDASPDAIVATCPASVGSFIDCHSASGRPGTDPQTVGVHCETTRGAGLGNCIGTADVVTTECQPTSSSDPFCMAGGNVQIHHSVTVTCLRENSTTCPPGV